MTTTTRRRALGLMLALSLALVTATPSALAAKTINLKFSTWHPPASLEVKTVWQPMLAELEKRSHGRIKTTLYAGSALGKGPEHFDIVKNGLSDFGYFTATWTPGRFPVSDVLSLATPTKGKDVSTDIGNKMYSRNRTIQDEFKDVKVLELNGCISSYLWTKKPVKTLEDVKGLKIRSPGGHQTNYIKSLGAQPVFMPLGDVYLALETGTIDGLVTCPPLVVAFKLHEVLKHGVVATFGCVTEGVVMNKKSWAKLGPDLQKVVQEVVGNPFETSHGLTSEAYGQLMTTIKTNGVEIYELPQAEQDRWAKGFQEETKKWVAKLEKQGKPAKEAVLMYNKIVNEAGLQCVAVPLEWR